ncbi:hypothetical protein AAW14_20790 [Streptomyces hygroscopicus]|nr:hypothetical protein [Streptomyces hygroscopicus]
MPGAAAERGSRLPGRTRHSAGCRCGVDGRHTRNSAPSPGAVLKLHGALVGRRQGGDDGQAQPCAAFLTAAGGIDSVEAFEDAGGLLCSQPWSGVGHFP